MSLPERVPERVRDAYLGDPDSVALLLAANAVGVLVGVRFYLATLPAVPTLLWPLYADSPVALALASLAVAPLLAGGGVPRRATGEPEPVQLAYLRTLAVAWLVKYGVWPAVALTRRADLYLGAPGALWDFWGIVLTHLLFVAEAVLLATHGRTTRGALAAAAGLLLVNDAVDYLFGYHPPLRYEPGLAVPAATVGLSLVAVAAAARWLPREA